MVAADERHDSFVYTYNLHYSGLLTEDLRKHLGALSRR